MGTSTAANDTGKSDIRDQTPNRRHSSDTQAMESEEVACSP
jgi:hypothetical protein